MDTPCPRCGYLPESPPPAPSSPPARHRWLEASLPCPECLEPVEVLTAAAQGDEELDEQVYVHGGDLWLCSGGHLGSVIVSGTLAGAYLADPVEADRTRADAEAHAEAGVSPVQLRAPLRRGAA